MPARSCSTRPVVVFERCWTYTKVNRCLSEGRRSFVERVSGIESGAECRRLEPLLSAFADGEASARDLATLRPHLRGCLSCKASLRDFRAAPAQVAALVPPAVVATQGGELPALGGLDTLLGWLHERTALVALRLQGAVEMASSQKVAAVAASTAALAGGGAATMSTLERSHPPAPRVEREEPRTAAREAAQSTATPRVVARATPPRPAAALPTPRPAAARRAARPRAAAPVPARPRARESAPRPRSQDTTEFAREFDGAPAVRATTASAPPAVEPVASPETPSSAAGSAEFSSSPAPLAGPAASDSSEFGP